MKILVSDNAYDYRQGEYPCGSSITEALLKCGMETVEIADRHEAAWFIKNYPHEISAVVTGYDKSDIERAWKDAAEIGELIRTARGFGIKSLFVDYPSMPGITCAYGSAADEILWRDEAGNLCKTLAKLTGAAVKKG